MSESSELERLSVVVRMDRLYNGLELVHKLWDAANAVHSYGPAMIIAALLELEKTHDIVERQS